MTTPLTTLEDFAAAEKSDKEEAKNKNVKDREGEDDQAEDYQAQSDPATEARQALFDTHYISDLVCEAFSKGLRQSRQLLWLGTNHDLHDYLQVLQLLR
jgi:hypothetical protein